MTLSKTPGAPGKGKLGQEEDRGQVCWREEYLLPFNFLYSREGNGTPTPVLLPGESHGRRSPVGCRLWGRTESDTTELT